MGNFKMCDTRNVKKNFASLEFPMTLNMQEGSSSPIVKGPIHDQSAQVCPFTIKSISTIHGQPVAQHAMLRNMIDRVWAPLGLKFSQQATMNSKYLVRRDSMQSGRSIFV
jgi:hypothetical protein